MGIEVLKVLYDGLLQFLDTVKPYGGYVLR